jgi:PleD family two-component response regulator
LRTGANPHFEHLLHEADQALYAAKSKGRDQVSYFTPQAA